MKAFNLRLTIALLAVTMISASEASAQDTSRIPRDDTVQIRGRLLVRAMTAALGWLPGAFVGGYLGYNILEHKRCSCDDPGLREIVIGATFGGVVGAGVGAAFPELKSRCSFGKRLGLGLLGAAIGTGAGMIPLTEGAQIITVPLFSSIGAAFGDSRC